MKLKRIPNFRKVKESKSPKRCANYKNERPKNKRDWPMILLTAGVVVVSAWNVVAYKNATHAENRAYIVVSRIDPSGWDIGKPARFKTTVRNVGKTPAYNIVVHTATMLDTTLQEDEPIRGQVPDTNRYVIAPGESLSFFGESKIPLDTIRVLSIRTGLVRLFAYTTVAYNDVFDGHHRTTACARFDTENASFRMEGRFNYQK